jgi:hypothetical protein
MIEEGERNKKEKPESRKGHKPAAQRPSSEKKATSLSLPKKREI